MKQFLFLFQLYRRDYVRYEIDERIDYDNIHKSNTVESILTRLKKKIYFLARENLLYTGKKSNTIGTKRFYQV